MSEMLLTLKQLIRTAGAAVLSHSVNSVGVEYKEDHSPVTDADMSSHHILLEGLAGFGYPVISEEGEGPSLPLQGDYVWFVDPLDGTKDFLEANGEFSIIVGLVYRGSPVLGLVYTPSQRIIYYAEKGKGAFLEEKSGTIVPLHVSDRIVNPTMLVSRHHVREKELKLAARLGINNIIPCGSMGIKAGLIADGKAEIYVNSGGLSCEWDICAPEIIISEAGGKVTDLDGKKIVYNKKLHKNINGVVITNGKFHDKVIEELGKI